MKKLILYSTYFLAIFLFCNLSCCGGDSPSKKPSKKTTPPLIPSSPDPIGSDEGSGSGDSPSKKPSKKTTPPLIPSNPDPIGSDEGSGSGDSTSPLIPSTTPITPPKNQLIPGIRKFNVPGDGNCMLHSASIGYLLMAKNDSQEFNNRFLKLFSNQIGEAGDQIEVKDYQDIIESIKSLDLKNLTTTSVPNSRKWIELLNRLRKKLNFFINLDKQYFQGFFDPNNLENEGTKDFDDYMNKTKQDTTYLSDIHLNAIHQVIQYPIDVYDIRGNEINGSVVSYRQFSNNTKDENARPLILFHLSIHYNFGLPEELCE